MALQKQFPFLQQALGYYEGGQVQFDLGRIVTPVIDIRDYMVGLEMYSEVQAVTNSGDFISPVAAFVPQDEEWIVWHIGAHSNAVLGVGEVLNGCCCIRQQQQTVDIPINQPMPTSNTNPQQFMTGHFFPRGFQVNEAMSIGFKASHVMNGPINVKVTVLLQRIHSHT